MAFFQAMVTFWAFKHSENSAKIFSGSVSSPSLLKTTVIRTSSRAFSRFMPFKPLPTPSLVTSVHRKLSLLSQLFPWFNVAVILSPVKLFCYLCCLIYDVRNAVLSLPMPLPMCADSTSAVGLLPPSCIHSASSLQRFIDNYLVICTTVVSFAFCHHLR